MLLLDLLFPADADRTLWNVSASLERLKEESPVGTGRVSLLQSADRCLTWLNEH